MLSPWRRRKTVIRPTLCYIVLGTRLGAIVTRFQKDCPMNVQLTPELEKFVEEKVEAGQFLIRRLA